MRRILLIAFILSLVALAGSGQQARLLATKTAPKSVQAILYYPNQPPETIDLPVEFKVPVENWDWSVKEHCLQYRVGKEETTFCGTFKLVRTYE
jgi:hypothetical protein